MLTVADVRLQFLNLPRPRVLGTSDVLRAGGQCLNKRCLPREDVLENQSFCRLASAGSLAIVKLTSPSLVCNRKPTSVNIFPNGVWKLHSMLRYQWNLVAKTGLATARSMRNWASPLSPTSLADGSLRRRDRVEGICSCSNLSA